MENALRAALIAHLAADPALAAALNSVAGIPADAASPPWLAMAASASVDWGTKDARGREVRVALELHTRGDDPAADGALVRRIEDVALAAPAPAGLAIASAHFLRSRAERRDRNRRAVLLEFRFRCLEHPTE